MAGTEKTRIERGVLVNQATAEMQEFLFNPIQVTTNLTVNWDRHVSLAASFERLHYRNTSNVTVSLELTVNRMMIALRRRDVSGRVPRGQFASIREEFSDRRKFLLSLCYPRGLPNDPVRRSPPSALFLWPSFMAMEIVITQVGFTDEAWAINGEPISFKANLQLEEVRDYRLTSAQARRDGYIRAGGIRRGEEPLLGRP